MEMLRILKSEGLLALRRMFREPSSIVLTIGSIGVGIGIVLPLFALARGPETPFAIPRHVVDLPSTIGFDQWSSDVSGPAVPQGEALSSLLAVLALLTTGVGLIAAVNLFLFALSRSGSRRFEAAVLASLGYGKARIWSRVAIEFLLIAALGLLLAACLGAIRFAVLQSGWPDSMPEWLNPDHTATLAAAMAAIVLGLLLLSSWRPVRSTRRARLADTLALGPSTENPGSSGGTLRRLFLVKSVAVAAIVLPVAAVLAAAPGGASVDSIAPEADHLTAAIVELRSLQTAAAEVRADALGELLSSVLQAEDIENASLSSAGGALGIGVEDDVMIDCGRCVRGGGFAPVGRERANFIVVSPSHFDTLGIERVAGRGFEEEDRPGGELVAIVNRTLANRSFESSGAVGRSIVVGGLRGVRHTVVGVVEDRGGIGLGGTADGKPTVYLSAWQHPPRIADLTLRSRSGATPLLTVGPPPLSIGGLTAFSALAAAQRRPAEWLGRRLREAGWATLLFAVASIYSVFAHSVRQRTWEIGLRKATGATNGRIRRMIVGEAIVLTVGGTGVGLLLAWNLTRGLQLWIPDLPLPGARLLMAVMLATAGAAVLGSWWPTRAASSLDPAEGLRR